MLKNFESFNELDPYGEDDWDKPYPKELSFGKDGPEFRCGDRVMYIYNNREKFYHRFKPGNIDRLIDEEGIVVHYDWQMRYGGQSHYYLICFDKEVGTGFYGAYKSGYHDPRRYQHEDIEKSHNIPTGHGAWVNVVNLEKKII